MRANSPSRILVTGATGLLGTAVVPLLLSRTYQVIRHGRSQQADVLAELTDPEQTASMLDDVRPEVIINLAALTDVDACEAHPRMAYLANSRVVENIAAWMRRSVYPCHLIQMSTDHVYDGNGPHREDQITLTNYYAFSKYAGELAAAIVPSTILRSNFFGPSRTEKRRSLTDWLYHSLTQGHQIDVYEDVVFNPLSLHTLSEMIEFTVRRPVVGVFNLGSRDGLTKADFAFAFADVLQLPTRKMRRTTSDKVRVLKTYRPKDMRMDCTRFEQTMNLRLPTLADQIKSMKGQYNVQS
jgi:dTDP-4-dehydrorhamnose reductase